MDDGFKGAEPGARPRILFVSDEVAWPPISGYRQRTAQCLRALAEVGSVDWLAAPRQMPSNLADIGPPDVECSNVRVCAITIRPRTSTMQRWCTRTLPWPLAASDWTDADAVLGDWSTNRYDLVWAMGIDPWLAVARAGIVADASVIDTDVESEKLRLRVEVRPWTGWHRLLREPIARIDVARWKRLESAAAGHVTAVCVCSDEEASHIDGPTWVAANATRDPGPRDRDRRDGVLLFVGSLSYDPNLDGITRFAVEVLPRVRAAAPTCRLRVVGAGLPEQHVLRDLAGVDVVGPVDDAAVEFDHATALVVPLRWGGGTRVKIVEAFAHGVPVVSTTVGAAGLGAVDGVHLLLADGDESFSEACVRVLSDPELGDSLARAGRELFAQHFDSRVLHEMLTTRIRSLVR